MQELPAFFRVHHYVVMQPPLNPPGRKSQGLEVALGFDLYAFAIRQHLPELNCHYKNNLI